MFLVFQEEEEVSVAGGKFKVVQGGGESDRAGVQKDTRGQNHKGPCRAL